MKLADRIRLIPRNNWDFGLKEMTTAFAASGRKAGVAPNAMAFFQSEPVWVNTGRTALYAILKSLDLPAGSQVGVPLFCCSVVFDAIQQAGFTPCFLDSNLEDCNLSIDDLRAKRGRLSAVVAVHMFGIPCHMDALNAAAEGLPVIEDCAQSVYSTYHGIPSGHLAAAAFYSFRCGKYISAGEGSAIRCDDPVLREKIRLTAGSFQPIPVRHGRMNALFTYIKAVLYNRPWYGLIGHPLGMRLDKKLNLTAKDGFETAQIHPGYLEIIDRRLAVFQQKIDVQREHARLLLGEVKPGPFVLPGETEGCARNWFQFPLRFQTAEQRDAMSAYLFGHGIDTARYLDTIVEDARAAYGYRGGCPNAEQLSKTILLVPIHYSLSAKDLQHISQTINQASSETICGQKAVPSRQSEGVTHP